jgi:hypothetical protein
LRARSTRSTLHSRAFRTNPCLYFRHGSQPQMLEARELCLCLLKDHLVSVPIHDVGGVHLGFEHQTLCVYEQVVFSALYLLAAVVSSLLSSYTGALDRLAIDDARTRLRITTHTSGEPFV